jgi:hypothetical protein
MGEAVRSRWLELKLVGGLGNQLFQYATARSLCSKCGIPSLLLNAESYKSDPFGRELGLMHFRIKGSIVRSGFLKTLLRKGTRLNRLLSGSSLYGNIEEQGLKLHRLEDNMKLLTSLNGYWQSEYYFKEIRQVLLEELIPSECPVFPEWQSGKDTVAVHIRRMDYLKESGFGALSEQYYQDAMNIFRQKLSSPVFVFFSDDIAWCKETFRDESYIFCEEKEWSKDYLQLFLLSKCRHQIIANSSFSWWGAWLNSHQEKIVIRPARPFADETLMYESYYPTEWIPVNNYATR